MAGLILVIGLTSCEKQNKHDLEIEALKAAKITYIPGDMPGPTSHYGVSPVIIDGDNKGGNRTCEEVWLELGPEGAECGVDYLCGEKVDYDDDPEGFASSFPKGLTVIVDGIHIEFEVDDCVAFDQWIGEELVTTYWKVGAVIVKGSNAANVYWYPDGETHDWGLAAPGDKHMVSNLTFCFVPCTPPDEDRIFGVKVWYYTDVVCQEESFAISGGTIFPYENVDKWCDVLGFNIYKNTVSPIALGSVGEITVLDGAITITMDEGYNIYSASVFVGNESELDDSKCPAYKVDWHYVNDICDYEYSFPASTFIEED